MSPSVKRVLNERVFTCLMNYMPNHAVPREYFKKTMDAMTTQNIDYDRMTLKTESDEVSRIMGHGNIIIPGRELIDQRRRYYGTLLDIANNNKPCITKDESLLSYAESIRQFHLMWDLTALQPNVLHISDTTKLLFPDRYTALKYVKAMGLDVGLSNDLLKNPLNKPKIMPFFVARITDKVGVDVGYYVRPLQVRLLNNKNPFFWSYKVNMSRPKLDQYIEDGINMARSKVLPIRFYYDPVPWVNDGFYEKYYEDRGIKAYPIKLDNAT